MKLFSIVCCLLILVPAIAQKNALGVFENHSDAGNPKIKGSTAYNKKTKAYTLTGGGYNIWFDRDEFQFA